MKSKSFNNLILIIKAKNKSDVVGVLASALCLIHCFATPFLFVIQSSSINKTCFHSGPIWWKYIDVLFIVITFFAVHFSSKSASKNWLKYGLYISWVVLTVLVFNEINGFVQITKWFKYFAAFCLIAFHLINISFYKKSKHFEVFLYKNKNT